MASISGTLTEYHRCCEGLFKAVEEAVASALWDQARDAFGMFRRAMDQHYQMEEEILFPAFERRSGKTDGPTRVLRFEHEQIRSLMDQVASGIEAEDQAQCMATSGRLKVTNQQHTQKEERMMYPIVDELLAGEAATIVAQMRCLGDVAPLPPSSS